MDSRLIIYLFICNILYFTEAHGGLHLDKNDFEFNGASDFLQIAPNPSLDIIKFTQHISIEITVQITELNRQQSLIEKYGCGNSELENGGFYLRLNSNNLICFAILNNCVNYVEYCGQTQLKIRNVYHIAATYAEGRIALYINGTYDFAQTDGALIAPNTDSVYLTNTSALGFMIQENRKLYSGKNPIVVGARGNDYQTKFKGIIKDIKLWSVPRSAQFFRESPYMNLTGTELGLMAWWPKLGKLCDQSVVPGFCMYEDFSANGNHLKYQSGPWDNLEKFNWDFCCFWWGPGTAFKVDTIIDERGGLAPAMFVSDQEKGILLDMRKYKESYSSREAGQSVSSIQLCATVAVHNVSFGGPNPAEIQVTMDIEYEDQSYLREQTINYIFDSKKRDIPHLFAEDLVGQPTSEWQRKCLIVEGIRPVRYILLVLVAKNNPKAVTMQSQSDVFKQPESSFAVYKDISIRPITQITRGDYENSAISSDIPLRIDTYTVEEFFVKAEYTPDLDMDVTYVTQLSIDRLDRLLLTAERHRGPISAAVYIRHPEEDLPLIMQIVKESEYVRKFIDFHLLYQFQSGEFYPVNSLRNLATRNARTPLVFHIDADFIPTKNMRDKLSKQIPWMMKTSKEKAVFVIPAFELDKGILIPEEKEELVELFERNQSRQIHIFKHFASHGAIDYPKWLISFESRLTVTRTLALNPYHIDYALYFEPYVVARKTLPPFSEIFRGYGNDKDQWFRELYLRNYQFWVLPDVFTVHFEHEEANWSKTQASHSRRWRNYSLWYNKLLFELQENSEVFLEAQCKADVAALQVELEKKQNELRICESEEEFLELKKEFSK